MSTVSVVPVAPRRVRVMAWMAFFMVAAALVLGALAPGASAATVATGSPVVASTSMLSTVDVSMAENEPLSLSGEESTGNTKKRPGPNGPKGAKGATGVNIEIGGAPSNAVTMILAITVLSVAPALLLLVTSFTKVVVVLSMTRNAVGLATAPPNQVIVGLALFLTLFIMAPVLGDINTVALQPYLNGDMNAQSAFDTGIEPLREFLMANTRQDEMRHMIGLSGQERPADPSEITMTTLIPAFIMSELKSAFIIGLVIFIPFLILDILISLALQSLGMMMVPPVIISLPFKIGLMVMSDGWVMITKSLVESYS